MKIALCIEGGGAKGAYEAGVIKALYDNGIKEYSAVAGTSIGAINGYFVATDNIEKLAYTWNNLDDSLKGKGVEIIDNTINNEPVIDILRELEEGNRKNTPLYVNYVEVNDKNIEEKTVNTSELELNECLKCVKWSSLLPCNPNKKMGFKEAFMEDLSEGIYDGRCLDGGVVRNIVVRPIIETNPDKILIISTKDDYKILDEFAEKFGEENFIVARPKYKFEPSATLNMNADFCRKIFAEGYEIGEELVREFK